MKRTANVVFKPTIKDAKGLKKRDKPIIGSDEKVISNDSLPWDESYLDKYYKWEMKILTVWIIQAKCADRKSESRLEEPDFSMLLTGERNQWEMLDLFVRETENNKAILQQALNDKDPEKIAAVVHRALPVWIMVGIDMPLSQLQALTRLTPNNQPDDASFITVRNLIEAIAWLSEKATELRNKKMT